MEDYFEGFSENLTDWESVMRITELDLDDPSPLIENNDHQIHRFFRQDFQVYGLMPKIEKRMFIKCRDCKLIFSPLDISCHKTCVTTSTPNKSLSTEKKTKSRSGSSKKSQNSFPLPPVFTKTSSPNRAHSKDSSTKATKVNTFQSVNSTKIDEIFPESELKGVSPDVPSPSCLSTDSLSLDGDSSSPKITSTSRSGKKSRKGKSARDFDPDLHCGVTDAQKGPCLRSITCSNHRIQLKKLVPGRSKDIHQLIAEKRLTKERELFGQSVRENPKLENASADETVSIVIKSPIEVINDTPTAETSAVKHELMDHTDHKKFTEEFIDDTKHFEDFNFTTMDFISSINHQQSGNIAMQKDFENFLNSLPTFNEENGIRRLDDIDFSHITSLSPFRENHEIKPLEEFKFNEIQPMSPFQQYSFSKEESLATHHSIPNLQVTDERPQCFTIPDFELKDNNVTESHPKPVAMPNYGMRKYGGAILFSKPQLQLQRNDILKSVNDSRINYSNTEKTNSSIKRNYCNPSVIGNGRELKQMRLDPNLNHFSMQYKIRSPFNEALLDECLQENFGMNSLTSTIDFE